MESTIGRLTRRAWERRRCVARASASAGGDPMAARVRSAILPEALAAAAGAAVAAAGGVAADRPEPRTRPATNVTLNARRASASALASVRLLGIAPAAYVPASGSGRAAWGLCPCESPPG